MRCASLIMAGLLPLPAPAVAAIPAASAEKPVSRIDSIISMWATSWLMTAIALFGFQSGAALATVVGVLVEVPVMLSVVHIVSRSRGWYEGGLA